MSKALSKALSKAMSKAKSRGGSAAGALAIALALAGAAQAGPVLAIAPATQQRLGVVTAPLAAARRGGTITAFARAVDAAPLATLDSDILTTAAALAASQAEANRTKALNAADQTVSRKEAEAAQAQARGDAAKLQLLRRRLGLEWGPGLARLSDARRGRLIADLAAGRSTLVRIDAAEGLADQHGTARIDLGAHGTALAAILGPTRSGDPRLQTTGVLALVSGPQALRLGVGATAPAVLATGGGEAGVLLPRAALLRADGHAYAYVREDAGHFERREVARPLADPQGYFVASGFRPGEAVVVAGAMQLFAAERAPSAPAKARDDD